MVVVVGATVVDVVEVVVEVVVVDVDVTVVDTSVVVTGVVELGDVAPLAASPEHAEATSPSAANAAAMAVALFRRFDTITEAPYRPIGPRWCQARAPDDT